MINYNENEAENEKRSHEYDIKRTRPRRDNGIYLWWTYNCTEPKSYGLYPVGNFILMLVGYYLVQSLRAAIKSITKSFGEQW